jgi:hypothetical protein
MDTYHNKYKRLVGKSLHVGFDQLTGKAMVQIGPLDLKQLGKQFRIVVSESSEL